jgi:hypothetical protein
MSNYDPYALSGMGSNPTGSAAIDNWNMNDLENSIKHGWWNSDKLRPLRGRNLTLDN